MPEIRVDLKGKYYTDHVTKRDVPVIAATNHNIIHGVVHLTVDNRLKDELNVAERFIAVTAAEVFDLTGKTRLYKSDFIALNKDLVVWVLPREEPGSKP